MSIPVLQRICPLNVSMPLLHYYNNIAVWQFLNHVSCLCLVALEGTTAGTNFNHARSAVIRI